MKFDQLAQEMVEATSRLVRMRTINIMDTNGIIIASTQTERIGSFHKGAQEVIRTGKPVYIRFNTECIKAGTPWVFRNAARLNENIFFDFALAIITQIQSRMA